MKKYWPVLVIFVVSNIAFAWFIRNHFPVTIEQPKPIPHIITKYDTTEVFPKWLDDSVKIWKKKLKTTDTVPVFFNYTSIKIKTDTLWKDVSDGRILPIVALSSGKQFGDTGFIETINVGTHERQVSKFFTSGFITSLEATLEKPRINFSAFKVDTLIKKRSSLLSLLLSGSVGYSACRLQTLITGK